MNKSTVLTVSLILSIVVAISGVFFYLFRTEQRTASDTSTQLAQELYGNPFRLFGDTTYTQITSGTVQSISSPHDLRQVVRDPNNPTTLPEGSITLVTSGAEEVTITLPSNESITLIVSRDCSEFTDQDECPDFIDYMVASEAEIAQMRTGQYKGLIAEPVAALASGDEVAIIEELLPDGSKTVSVFNFSQ